MSAALEYKNKRILPVFMDLSVATTTNVDVKQLGFEPNEVRLLQYGASNDEKAQGAGIVICDQLPDFNLIICCPAESSVSSQGKMACPSSGPLSRLKFTFTVSGAGGAPQVAQDMQVFMVLEFLRK